jgi:hypothetical protein
MPTSITPPPKDDEVECGNCGAYIYYDLVKCPHCGVYLDEPNEREEERVKFQPRSKFALWVESTVRKLRGEPHPAEDLFIGIVRQKDLFDDLVRKAGGDPSAAERLVEYEKQLHPNATRLTCIQNAIRHWERENS